MHYRLSKSLSFQKHQQNLHLHTVMHASGKQPFKLGRYFEQTPCIALSSIAIISIAIRIVIRAHGSSKQPSRVGCLSDN